MPAVLCAANEVAVSAFLSGRLAFTDIVPVVQDVLEEHDPQVNPDLDVLQASDRWARTAAENVLRRRAGR